MSGFEFLAWVAGGAIIFGAVGSVALFFWVKRENQRSVDEFKRKHRFK